MLPWTLGVVGKGYLLVSDMTRAQATSRDTGAGTQSPMWKPRRSMIVCFGDQSISFRQEVL